MFVLNYFNSTTAPAASKVSFNLAPSSAGTSFLISDGTLSTKPLASTSPKPVISLTALITLTFVGPTSLRITVTLAAGPSSSAAAATATGAAAVTSNFSSIAFTNSFNSKIVALPF